jgi:N-acetylmuramoyl-L-alanine amidase
MNIINTNLKYKNKLIPLDLSKVEFIFIHHIEARTATVEDIHRWHLNNGWNGFGYGEYIRKDGTVYIGRGDHIGAHCSGFNSVSYGIACEGSYDVEKTMPDAQFKSLVERTKFHTSRLKTTRVLPHNAFTKTSCPGQHFPMSKLYEALSKKEDVDVEKQKALEFLLKWGEAQTDRDIVIRFADVMSRIVHLDRATMKNILNR